MMVWQPSEEGRELLIKVLRREKEDGFQRLTDSVSTLAKNVSELMIVTKEIALRLVKLEKGEDK